MKQGKIFIISGPSGSGKTTLYKKLLSDEKRLVKSVSMTTRPKRVGEKHGKDYFFVSSKVFAHKRKLNQFLEFQKVFDNYYGTPKKNVKKLLAAKKNVLLCIDVKGAKVVRKLFPKAITIFVKTPSLAILRDRLIKRGSETQQTINLRIKRAQKELREARSYKYIVVNSQLPAAFAALRKIIDKELV